MDRLREISLNLLLGYLLAGISVWLKSTFLTKFLADNLIVVVVALLAINTTTTSVVMTKLREISERTGTDFAATVQQLRGSIREQIVFIFIATIGSILYSSERINAVLPWPEFTVGGLLAAVFVATLFNLHDTGESIFVILRYETRGRIAKSD